MYKILKQYFSQDSKRAFSSGLEAWYSIVESEEEAVVTSLEGSGVTKLCRRAWLGVRTLFFDGILLFDSFSLSINGVVTGATSKLGLLFGTTCTE